MFAATSRRLAALEQRMEGKMTAWTNRQDMLGAPVPVPEEAPGLGMPQYAGRPTAYCHDILGVEF